MPGNGIEADSVAEGWYHHRQLAPQLAEKTYLGSEGAADVDHGGENDVDRTGGTQGKRKRARTSTRTQGMTLVFDNTSVSLTS